MLADTHGTQVATDTNTLYYNIALFSLISLFDKDHK